MKNILSAALLLATGFSATAQGDAVRWSKQPASTRIGIQAVLQPKVYSLFNTSDALLQNALAAAPQDAATGSMISLPRPDGSMRTFRVWQTPVMEKELAAKYPGIHTLTAVATDDPSVSAKLDYSPAGFHAMVWSREGVYFIDPYNTQEAPGYYMAYYRRDYTRAAGDYMHCEAGGGELPGMNEEALPMSGEGEPAYRVNGATRKRYRLALACTGEYAAAVAGPSATKAAVLAKMIISVNRVNGVYERELAVTMLLVGNTDTLIFLDPNTDPYTNSNGSTMLGQNQTTVTQRIGSLNYDIGHVFSTGGGGIASLGCVCNSNAKAQGVTGSANPQGDPYDIDYVAHEIGHQFAGSHTFNSSAGSCSGNRSVNSAYEPGSGTTIMAYAGICSTDNTQANSDPFFHVRSLMQISGFITTGTGATCPVLTPTGNTPPVVPSITATYTIPFLTPFEITAPIATDADHDTLTYLWEQWNRGGSTTVQQPGQTTTPIFRSFVPSANRTRVFPVITRLVNNVTNYKGEMLPDVARDLTFKLTVRDILNGSGSWNYTEDSLNVKVINTGAGFAVTSPNTAVNLTVMQNETVTWDVSSTDLAPISTGTVDIYLSLDGGFTYPVTLATGVPNDGSHDVTIPNMPTQKARIKVKGSGNIFFDISNADFTIGGSIGVKENPALANAISVYPVPADDVLHITSDARSNLTLQLTNAIGQHVASADLQGTSAQIATAHLSPGVYYLKISAEDGGTAVKRVVIQ